MAWWACFLLFFIGYANARPSNVTLDVPYHRQFTDFSCGDASLEMVLDYYGKVFKLIVSAKIIVFYEPV